ncbi:MAG: prepilin-type N-terminal cleavage/methylation domain-containing protein [Candidatus Nealsonbacteria bacterium]|nr:prepilin-type N-terminal cleavage/methylation domain-containing protein [Candidatus Nealsonbacteria bacterium]
MRGFTIIETLVTVVIFGLIMGLVAGSIAALYKAHDYTWQQSFAIDEARRGIKTMVKEIREARPGDNGSYPIEKAGDKEFIFYSDIDGDGKVERVRYFLGAVNSGNEIKECQTSVRGGICNVNFFDFLTGTIISAQAKVSVDGDFGAGNEYADVYADGNYLGRICSSGCTDCPATWQGTTIFDVTNFASDDSIIIEARASSRVDPLCPHSMKLKVEFSFTEDISHLTHQFKKGVIKSSGEPAQYLSENEVITILTSYVRNVPPIFEYFNAQGDKIEEYPARLVDTKLMKVFLAVNIDPNKPPYDFELESYVQLRNL